ncbi:response regulator [Leptolyngbya sp. FACHB-36]|uniref:response regulator n=1 Tax=Leptolyngbya sp. FACHB-36 TaxID=2692808 RepID=UPI0016812154|nr:response regulator [Leptolyngbya sp. FACHB-36]
MNTDKETPPTAFKPTITTEQAVREGLSRIWERYKDQFIDRIATLEQASLALLNGQLNENLRDRAQQEAHKLVGSLGSFGCPHGSDLARQIEQLFRTSANLHADAFYLSELVRELRQSLTACPTNTELTKSDAVLPTPISRLLIVDDDRELTQQLAEEAKAWGIRVDIAPSVAEARSVLAQTRPDVVLLDLEFPGSIEGGLELLTTLAAYKPAIPVLVLTAQESFVDRVKVARLGGRGFLQKPMEPPHVLEAIAQVLQHCNTVEAKVLIVDDDPQLLALLRSLLEPWGLKLTLLDNSEQFWDVLEQTAPDLLILDVEMPNLSGIDLCQVVRNDPRWNEVPILFLSAHTDAETVQQVFRVGADDYVHKPIVPPELVARVLNRLERSHILRQLAETDPLTGLSNRRKSTQELTRLLRLAERQQQSLCLMVLDLDNFKQVNDQHGHEVGDRVLMQLSEFLRRTCRSEDVVARWGGEEFVIGMYGASRDHGVMRLTTILEVFRNQEFQGANERSFRATFSAGVAAYPQNGADLQSLYRAADAALYQAKQAGRDRILPAASVQLPREHH